jgi:hypothetical protein
MAGCQRTSGANSSNRVIQPELFWRARRFAAVVLPSLTPSFTARPIAAIGVAFRGGVLASLSPASRRLFQ